MKIFFLALFLTSCVEHIASDQNYSWQDGEIDLYVDPSMEEIADADIVYPIIEESFHLWLDEIDRDININFIYRRCPLPSNCVKMFNGANDLGITSVNPANGEIHGADIKISREFEWAIDDGDAGYDFRSLFLHEAGHFFGVNHSEIKGDIMYGYFKYSTSVESTELTKRDIEKINNLY
jgi:hypothetical protein